MTGENEEVTVQEQIVLHKYEGDPAPENLVETIYIEDGEIVHHSTATE